VSFQAPLFLLGLAVLPLLGLGLRAARRRRRRYAVRFPGTATVAAVLPTGLRRHRGLLPAALLMAALAALAVALARPQATVAVPDERATVVLVTDTSRSMLAEDVAPSRLAAAQTAARTFLERVPAELRVGGVAFAGSPRTLASPTAERRQLAEQIDQLVADGSTATGDALAAALALLGEPREDDPPGGGGEGPAGDGPAGDAPPAALVLLSDGASVTGRDPVDVAGEAGDRGVPIYTVSLGTAAASVPAPDGIGLIPVPPDPESMRAIAEASGGRAFDATDAETLDAVYEELGSQLGTRDERREVTAAFAAGAIVLLLGGVGLSLRWSGRLP
jgi:Ca-activated chloride channel family protein